MQKLSVCISYILKVMRHTKTFWIKVIPDKSNLQLDSKLKMLELSRQQGIFQEEPSTCSKAMLDFQQKATFRCVYLGEHWPNWFWSDVIYVWIFLL